MKGNVRTFAAAVAAVSLGGLIWVAANGPFIRLPSPTGAHPVGTMDVVLDGGTSVALWYPAVASPAGAARAAYRPDTSDLRLRERIVFPLVRPAALRDIPVAAGSHAVVLYIPGWGEKRSDNTALCEDLASHGFVVAAIDDLRPEPAMDFSSESAFAATVRWADVKLRIESSGVRAMLTALEHVAPSHPAYEVTSAMDFGRVAAVGFSFGGATAAETAIADPRVRAAVNLDGWTFGDAAQHGVEKPFMIVGTGAATLVPPAGAPPQAVPLGRYEAELDAQNAQQIAAGFRRYGGYYVSIDGTQHESFCDSGFLPLRLRPIPGAIDGRRAQRIIATYVNEFLDFVLNGNAGPLLTRPPAAGDGALRSALDQAAELTIWSSPMSPRRSSS